MYRTRFVLGKDYVVLDPFALEKVELGKDLDDLFLEEHSKLLSFDEISTLVIKIDGNFYQYVVANKKLQGLKTMALFEPTEDADVKETTKRDFVSIFESFSDIVNVQKELSAFDSLYEQRIQDLENNQGVYLELPDKFGEELGDKIIAAYLIQEKDGFKPRVKPVTLSHGRWSDYQDAIESGDSLFNIFNEFFVEH